jgi:hypothetical protein
MQANLLNPSSLGYASRAHFLNSNLLVLIGVLTASGCFPPPISDGGDSLGSETGFGSETSDLPGDGDGDPGDGDGDGEPCDGPAPALACSDIDGCWASEPSWTASARASDADIIVTPGIWVPVELGVGSECWELWGVGTHACFVETCGVNLLGTPAAEMPLEPPGPACDFVGAWEATASIDDKCYGLLDGVAVELRTTAEGPCSYPLAPCPNDDCGADGRRNFTDMDCGADGCLGLWSGADLWSSMIPIAELLESPPVDPSTIWECEPDPDVDLCTDLDVNGTAECFRIDGEFAVAVQPSCAVGDVFAVDAGNDMCSAPDITPTGQCDDVVVECVDQEGCWVTGPTWTGKAASITQESVDAIINSDSWNPIDLGVGDACWAAGMSDLHICIASLCGELVVGLPATEFTLGAPQPYCDFVGPWDSAATVIEGDPAGGCVGVIDGVAVEIRAAD